MTPQGSREHAEVLLPPIRAWNIRTAKFRRRKGERMARQMEEILEDIFVELKKINSQPTERGGVQGAYARYLDQERIAAHKERVEREKKEAARRPR